MGKWIVEPNISFRHDNFLMVNNRTIEAADITPDYLHDVIDISDQTIRKRLERLHNERSNEARSDATPSQIILIARLALLHRSLEVLSSRTILHHTEIFESADDVENDFTSYWDAVTQTNFGPVIHANIDLKDPVVDGTWIGVHEKNYR
jgi:hypothetical protein